jgi:alpha-ketoglutarate-dependent taurine dioxygenase
MKAGTRMTSADPPARALPYVLERRECGTEVLSDAAAMGERLLEHGAVLLRGFDIAAIAGFEQVVRTLSGPLLAYSERSSPRSSILNEVYTSTDYPREEEIFLHNENSYQAAWPRRLHFFCATPPESNGATPLADTRVVLTAIDPDVRAEFTRRGWMVVRNFHDGFGPSWQYVFGTDEPSDADAYCQNHGIRTEWRSDNALRTTAVRRPVHVHPQSGQHVWFNHIAFFHHTTLPAEVCEGLLGLFDEADLPTDTRYGDGGKIPDDVVAHLRDCYRNAQVRFDWRRDDVLIIDNMLAAHGREPFTGPRKIAVAMTELFLPAHDHA